MPKKSASDDQRDVQGICASYFENHISPLLKLIQKSQEQFDQRLEDSRTRALESIEKLNQQLLRKANAFDVPTKEEVEVLVAKAVADVVPSKAEIDKRVAMSIEGSRDNGVTMLKRMQELTAKVHQKADASEVARLSNMISNKASARDVHASEQKMRSYTETSLSAGANAVLKAPALTDLQDRIVAMEDNMSTREGEMLAQLHELVGTVKRKAETKEVPTLQQLEALRKDLSTLPSPSHHDSAPVVEASSKFEVKKMQVLIAAAASRFDKQLKDVRQQVQDLKHRNGTGPATPCQADTLEERWPGRVLTTPTPGKRPTPSEDDVDEVRSVCGSTADSCAYSVTSLSPEERAELKKIQTVVAAAGTAFTREMRELKGQLRELRGEVLGVKKHLNLPEPAAVKSVLKDMMPKAGKIIEEIS